MSEHIRHSNTSEESISTLYGKDHQSFQKRIHEYEHFLYCRRSSDLYWLPLMRHVRSRVGTLSGERVLDIGCGSGACSTWLALLGGDVLGIDIDDSDFGKGHEKAQAFGVADQVDFAVASSTRMPFKDESFSVIFSRSVMQYVDHREMLAACRRVLAPNGRLILLENLMGNPWVKLYRRLRKSETAWNLQVQQYIALDEIPNLLTGLQVSDTRTHHFFLPLSSVFSSLGWTRGVRGSGRMLRLLDRLVLWGIPPLRRWSWYVSIIATKGAPDDINLSG